MQNDINSPLSVPSKLTPNQQKIRMTSSPTTAVKAKITKSNIVQLSACTVYSVLTDLRMRSMVPRVDTVCATPPHRVVWG